MNNPTASPDDPLANLSREEMLSALFANMVVQQTNMAMMFLGKVPHPETGEFIKDEETARMFIDQLEMLEAKTKGNLSKQEEALLKQALTTAHMSFVEAVDAPAPAAQPKVKDAAPAASSEPAPAAKTPDAPAPETPPAADESRKKFSKKY